MAPRRSEETAAFEEDGARLFYDSTRHRKNETLEHHLGRIKLEPKVQE
jgi:hypothetical protein